jgi:hypothetical protein
MAVRRSETPLSKPEPSPDGLLGRFRQIEEGVGFHVSVRPIVVFPGWWIEPAEGAHRDVWVLEPKALPAFLERETVVLDTPHVRQISYHISRYIRTFAE